MTNRYADDIRRIVGIDPNRSVLSPTKKKDAIGSKRGIGYINGNTGSANSASGTGGVTQLPTDNGINNNDSGENKAGEVGLSPENPYFAITDDTAGVVDVKDIIDGADETAKLSSPQVTDSGLSYINNPRLNGINAIDCDTGTAVNIRLRDDFIPPSAVYDENGNLLMEQWTDANTPPLKVGFLLGKYWECNIGGIPNVIIQSVTWVECAFACAAGLDIITPSRAPHVFLSGVKDFYDISHPNLYRVDATFSRQNPSGTFTLTMSLGDCTSNPPGDPAICPIAQSYEEFWPVYEEYRLKRDTSGQFVSSPYDSVAPAKYKNPASSVDFCFDTAGSRQGRMEATKDGGVMIYETSAGNPTGIVRVWDTNGSMIAAFDATTAADWIKNYRPNPA